MGLKRPGLEADHSPSSNATIRRRTTSAPPTSLHGVDRDNFTVFFYCHVLAILRFAFTVRRQETVKLLTLLSANEKKVVSSE